MDFFARIWEQAKDLWSRPAGKWIFGGVAALIGVAVVSVMLMSRPVMVPLGSFTAKDATAVVQRLQESRIPFTQSGSGTQFVFHVNESDMQTARIVLADLNLDPAGSEWTIDPWKDRISWSDTEFDKRQQKVEQMQTNLARSIEALGAVARARVTITAPEPTLFKSEQNPPKATVILMPEKDQALTTPMVEGIMEVVASSVEGLEKTNVVVMDASTNRLVSADAFKERTSQELTGQLAADQFTILQKYQEHFQEQLKRQLEVVVGAGNVSVIVNPTFNWEAIAREAKEYKSTSPDGQGFVLSTQTTKSSGEGGAPAQGAAVPGGIAGTTPNSETGTPPGYPGTTAPGSTGSWENSSSIINRLVDETITRSEKSGGIEEIAVGVLVNQSKLKDPAMEQTIHNVVTVAMGPKARVQVAAAPFNSALDVFDQPPPTPLAPPASLNWLAIVLGVSVGLGAIGFFFVAIKPRRPVLEPVFAGPESALMGGIPVTELDLAAANQAYSNHVGPSAGMVVEDGRPETRLPEKAEDLAAMPPEEIALLGDDFLEKLGVDPAKVRMKEKVEKIARTNPEAVASLLKTWIVDE